MTKVNKIVKLKNFLIIKKKIYNTSVLKVSPSFKLPDLKPL